MISRKLKGGFLHIFPNKSETALTENRSECKIFTITKARKRLDPGLEIRYHKTRTNVLDLEE